MKSAFAELHHGPKPLLLPNAWDHASAAAFSAAGYPAIGTTSLGVSAAAGLPDGAGASRERTVDLATALSQRGWMVTADIEGGYSDDPEEVGDLCSRLADAGVAGVNIEDGRADGSLRSIDAQRRILAAALNAAPNLFVNARTDNAWLRVGDARETLARAQAYADAGADGVFAPGVISRRELELIVASTPVPINALVSECGPTFAQLAAVGVARVSCGSLLYRAALQAATDALAQVRRSDAMPRLPAMTYEYVQRFAGRSPTEPP